MRFVSASVLALIACDASTVHVSVTRDGKPAAGARVHFMRADFSVIESVTTADDGLAASSGEPAIVSAILPSPNEGLRAAIVSIEGVSPDDDLAIRWTTLPPVRTRYAISYPLDPEATRHLAVARCGEEFHGAIELACAPPWDIAVTSFDAMDRPLHMLVARGVVPADGIAIAGAYEPLAPTTIALSNLPDTATDATATISIAGFATTRLTGPVAGGAITLAGGRPPLDEPARLHVEIVGSQRVWGMVDHGSDRGASDRALDFATIHVPTMQTFEWTPVFEQLTWEPTAGAITPDAAYMPFTVRRGEDRFFHAVFAPFTGPMLQAPPLPVEDFDLNSRDGDMNQLIGLTLVQLPGGYARFKSSPFDGFDSTGYPEPAPNERVLYSTYR